ncbi:MAG: hypothetical protein ACE5J5_07165 [Candidatus Hydrothermarchaeales archaeon]
MNSARCANTAGNMLFGSLIDCGRRNLKYTRRGIVAKSMTIRFYLLWRLCGK